MHASTFRSSTSGKVYRGEGRRVRVWLPLVLLLVLCAAAVSAQAPSPPSGLSVDESTGTDAGKASWTAVSGATAYILELQVGTTGSVSELRPGNHVTSVDFKVAPNATNCCKNGVAYRSRIKVTTSGGESAWSSWVNFTFNGTTSFTGTAFSVSLSLSYDHSAGTLRITTSTNGGTGTLSTTVCSISGHAGQFTCGTGTTTRSLAAGVSYTVVAVGERDTEKHTVSATINVPTDINDPVNRRGSSDSSNGGAAATPAPTATPPYFPTQDHSQLPAGAEVQSDSRWIAFREVSGDAISNAAVRTAAISAIDVWGPVGVDALVCFNGSGSVLLLDAAYSPRRQVWLNSAQRGDGKTCAQLDRAGTLVLMPGQPNLPPSPIATPRRHWAVIADSLDSRRTLDDCIVSASQLLNFRDRPAGRVPRLFIGGARAIARTDNWFQVEYLGKTGWISSHFVTTSGDCD